MSTDEHVALVADPQTPGLVWYYPTCPAAETDDDGRMAVTLLMIGTTASLSVGATLAVSAAELDAAATTSRSLVDDAVTVRLQPAPLTVRQARLELIDQHGEHAVLATSTSSGYPPFQAVFSAQLEPAAAAQAASALHGGSGHLIVTYDIEVNLPATEEQQPAGPRAASTLGRSFTLQTDVSTWFPSGPGEHLIVAGSGTS
jgi:hypothetical protein